MAPEPLLRMVTSQSLKSPSARSPLARRELHRQVVGGAKRDRGLELEGLAREDLEFVRADQGRQDQDSLHHGEVVTDADAGASAERETGVLMNRSGPLPGASGQGRSEEDRRNIPGGDA